MDSAYPLLKGEKCPVLIAVDLGDGKPIAIGAVDESHPQAVRRFLVPLVQRLGVSVIVTDDLTSFRSVAEELGVEHQVCPFCVRYWAGRMLRELRETMPKEWLWVLEEIRKLLAELLPEGDQRLFKLWRLIPKDGSGKANRSSLSAVCGLCSCA